LESDTETHYPLVLLLRGDDVWYIYSYRTGICQSIRYSFAWEEDTHGMLTFFQFCISIFR